MTSASNIAEPTAGAPEWTHALTPALVLGFVAIIFLLIATLVVGDLHLRNVYAAGEAVEHSEAVKVTLQQVLMVAGRTRLAIGSVDLGDVVRDAIDAVRLSADNKGVALVDDFDANLNCVKGDAARLKQVVCNLLANAIKFTPTGGQVNVAVRSVDRSVRIEVRDTGQGIEADFLPHVFERFRQAVLPTGAHGGLGLGLAIVRHLVELHGGTVTVQSAGLLQGSTFVVSLPAIVVPEAAGGEAPLKSA